MHYYYSHFSSIRHPKGTEKEKNFELKDIESTMYFAERTMQSKASPIFWSWYRIPRRGRFVFPNSKWYSGIYK
jgi:hypothetical protein